MSHRTNGQPASPRRMACNLLSAVALIMLPLAAPAAPGLAAAAAPTEGFAAPQFRSIWQRDDGPVAAGKVSPPWMWGPGPFHTNYEPYEGTPGASHLVQYFDKGRLEINDPEADPHSPWFVTSGRLVSEMVAGEAQVGEGGRVYKIGPARQPVSGSFGDAQAPTYAAFAGLTARAAQAEGQVTDTQLDASGKIGLMQSPPANLKRTKYEAATGHNWADVFWLFANAPDRPAGFDWLYTLGYPITEPVWVQARINGKTQPVLVQLFERRTLTYNPANPTALRVEMGNVGRHYYDWRYADLHTAQLDTKYDVRISVAPKPERITTVQERIGLHNNTGNPMRTVVFHAPWHHWDGVFTLQAAVVGDRQVDAVWREGINLEVTLPQAVPPGGGVEIAIGFEVRPRPVGGRTGYDRTNDILSLGDMLPTVVPWENGGWQVYPYSELGDLGYYLHSAYKVVIAPSGSEKLIVGGTGELSAHDPARSVWTFTAANLRDVAYVVSPRFVDPTADKDMTRQVGDVRVLAYFLPEHREQAGQQLALVAPALDWLGKTIGPYPFKQYTLAEMGVPLERTDNYAQEYPMAYFIPTTWLKLGVAPGSWTWFTPVHEATHQWFYSTVANNQLTDPWLDEALATLITAEYVRANFPAQYAQVYTQMTSQANLDRPVSSSVYSGFADESQYAATIYDTGAQMLNKIRLAMGNSDFYSGLQDYYAQYKFKKATPADLRATLQRHTKADLGAIFGAYLSR